MRVVVTRPEPDAGRWVDALRSRGHDAVALPLIAIGPAPSPEAVRASWAGLPRHRAAMFVSGNAVHGFFSGRAHAGWPPRVRAWAPGPGTAEALLAAGVPAASIDAPPEEAGQFDSEALWKIVEGQAGLGDTVLLVRGGDAQGRAVGRDWLASRLAEAGVVAEDVVCYTRGLPVWNDGVRAAARKEATGGARLLFSSSEAVRNLGTLMPGQDWAAACAIATHPRIADAARELGFGEVRIARATLSGVIASIESAR